MPQFKVILEIDCPDNLAVRTAKEVMLEAMRNSQLPYWRITIQPKEST